MAQSIEIYTQVQAPTVVCTARDGADGVTTGTAVNALNVLNCQTTAYVRLNLSASAATCTVFVLLYDAAGDFLCLAPPGVQTVTASAIKTDADAADFEAPAAAFDLCGAASYEVRTGDASSGTRTVTTWAV